LVQAGGVIENGSLLYGGGDLRLLSSALVNRFGNILAGDSLWIQRDAAGNAGDSVLNSSGTIETQRGDIRISTGTLTNQREGLVVTDGGVVSEVAPSWVGQTNVKIPISWFKKEEYGIYYDDRGPSMADKVLLYVPYKEYLTKKLVLSRKSTNVSSQGGTGLINSGNDISFSTSSLINQASSIIANRNISIDGSVLTNNSYNTGALVEYLIYKSISYPLPNTESVPNQYLSQFDPWIEYKLVSGPVYEQEAGPSYNATIQAGGAITASFSQNISNTSLQPGSGGFMPAMATPTLAGVNALTPVGAQADRGLNGGTAGNVSGSTLSGAGNGVALAGQTSRLNAGYSAVTRDGSVSSGSALNPVGIPAGLGTSGGAPV
ncbi:hemolysin BL-binding protein, partial [Dickeya dadantii]|nr:hemolysin BL-binding protein [Dickeya dadantii]